MLRKYVFCIVIIFVLIDITSVLAEEGVAQPPESETQPPEKVEEEKRATDKGGEAENPVYTVQIGAFSELDNAISVYEEMKDKGYIDIYLDFPQTDDESPLFRVQLGGFEDRALAEKLSAKFKEEEIDNFVTVRKNTAAVVSLAVEPASSKLSIGGSQIFKAMGTDVLGKTFRLPSQPTLIWRIDNEKVGQIDGLTGLFVAKRLGETQVKVEVGELSASATVTVAELMVEVYPTTYTTTLRGEPRDVQFQAGIKNAGDEEDIELSWEVYPEELGEISDAGVFTPKEAGDGNIIAIFKDSEGRELGRNIAMIRVVDITAPQIQLELPTDRTFTADTQIQLIKGVVAPVEISSLDVKIDDRSETIHLDEGKFAFEVELKEGDNKIELKAEKEGLIGRVSLAIEYFESADVKRDRAEAAKAIDDAVSYFKEFNFSQAETLFAKGIELLEKLKEERRSVPVDFPNKRIYWARSKFALGLLNNDLDELEGALQILRDIPVERAEKLEKLYREVMAAGVIEKGDLLREERLFEEAMAAYDGALNSPLNLTQKIRVLYGGGMIDWYLGTVAQRGPVYTQRAIDTFNEVMKLEDELTLAEVKELKPLLDEIRDILIQVRKEKTNTHKTEMQ